VWKYAYQYLLWLTTLVVYIVNKTIVKTKYKIAVFTLHVSRLYVKTADNKLSIIDGDEKGLKTV